MSVIRGRGGGVGPVGSHTHSEYAMSWAVTKILTRLGVLEARSVMLSAGSATVPTLIAGAQTTVQVTLKVPMVDTDYEPIAVLAAQGISILSSLQTVSWSVVTSSRVDVVVRNTGLVSLSGSTVLVIAIHN